MLRWILYNFIFAFAPLFIISISYLWSNKVFSLYTLFSHGEPFVIAAVLSAELIGKVVSHSQGSKAIRLLTTFSALMLFCFSSVSYAHIIIYSSTGFLPYLQFSSICVLIVTFVTGTFIYYVMED